MLTKINFIIIIFSPIFNFSQKIEGNYYSIEKKCNINLKIDSKDNYNFSFNKKNLNGIVKITNENNLIYLDFDNIGSMYSNDTIYIQNSGNSINPFWNFKNCNEKYIHLVKKQVCDKYINTSKFFE